MVTDGMGELDIYTMDVDVINEAPYADFGWDPYDPLVGQSVDFIDWSVPGEFCDYISSWSWDFDDGGTSTLQYPSHTFTSPGSYYVELTVEDGYGDADTWGQTITVSEVT